MGIELVVKWLITCCWKRQLEATKNPNHEAGKSGPSGTRRNLHQREIEDGNTFGSCFFLHLYHSSHTYRLLLAIASPSRSCGVHAIAIATAAWRDMSPRIAASKCQLRSADCAEALSEQQPRVDEYGRVPPVPIAPTLASIPPDQSNSPIATLPIPTKTGIILQ
jgi:hypothetical protein